MPKPKNRKSKYARRATVTQPAVQTSANTMPVSTAGAAAVARPTAGPGKSAARIAAAFHVPSVGSELKVIGLITVVILAAIFILYFALR